MLSILLAVTVITCPWFFVVLPRNTVIVKFFILPEKNT